jgi:glucose-6-phosphate 1-dehydrogenase
VSCIRLSYDSAIDLTITSRERNDYTFIFTVGIDGLETIIFFHDDNTENYSDVCEILMNDVLIGDGTLFTHTDEVNEILESCNRYSANG